jgi:type IV secretion system protein VirB4
MVHEMLTKEPSKLRDAHAELQADDSAAAGAAAAGDAVAFGYCTATVTVWATDLASAEEQLTQVERLITGEGFTVHRETINAVEAWLSSVPGHVHANIRRPLLSSMNIAHIMPHTALWGGPEQNAHLQGPPLLYGVGAGATPFRLSLHDGDVGHTLLIGPTGSGKSTAVALMALQFRRYPGAQVFAFDKGQSLRCATLAVGGQWYALGADAGVRLQPLRYLDEAGEPTWAAEWLGQLVLHEAGVLTPHDKAELWQAVASLATAPPGQRTLTGLVALLQSTTLREALRPYTVAGAFGGLLDADEDTLGAGPWHCFELEALLQTPSVIPAVVTVLAHQVQRRMTGAPTLFITDEFLHYMRHPAFVTWLDDYLKTARKANGSLLASIENLADAAQSPLAMALANSCVTKIFLPNARATAAALAPFYRGYDLNERQIALIAQAIPKRQYYYHSRQGCRLFELELGPVALAFCGASSKEDLRQMTALSAADPADFPRAWLAYKALDWAAALLQPSLTPDEEGVSYAMAP